MAEFDKILRSILAQERKFVFYKKRLAVYLRCSGEREFSMDQARYGCMGAISLHDRNCQSNSVRPIKLTKI